MDRRETERLLEAIRQARAAGEPAALATIVRVKGNAYRREGTRLLVRRDGSYEGALSGGCLEPAVAEAAARVIATGEPVIVGYDLADDSVLGLGMGCSGAIDIRIERLDDNPIMSAWLQMLELGKATVLVTPLAGVSGRMVVRGAGDVVGGLTDPTLEREAAAAALARLGLPYPHSGPERLGSAEVFYELARAPPELVIFGAGHDAAPVAQLAWALGFTVTVVDVREAFLTADRFPCATRVCAHFSQFAGSVQLPAGSFALIVNHQFERDQQSLRFSLESEAAYIGVLGPRSRCDRLLAGLAAQGYVPDSARFSRVRSPVGLALGAETPQEVAVSILGEILAIRRGFDGGFLAGSVRSLHRHGDAEDNRPRARS